MIRYEPPLPRVGFGVAALIMSALSVSLMVVLPSQLEQDSPNVVRAEPVPATAESSSAEALPLRCTVPSAVNAPLFSAARATGPEPRCGQQS